MVGSGSRRPLITAYVVPVWGARIARRRFAHGRKGLRVREGFRPVMLVPYDKVQFATGLFDSEGLGNRVGVQSIESFVGTNVEEMGGFSTSDIREGVAKLIRRYNERIYHCETDKSLMVEEPDWMVRIVGEWNPSEVIYAYVTTPVVPDGD